MRWLGSLLLPMLFAGAPLAAAAQDCPSGSVGAKPLSFTVNDDASGQAMGMAIIVGMTHEMKNHHLGLKLADPSCAAASIAVGSLRYVLRADDKSAWPRVAGERGEALLAVTLRPEAAARLVSGFVVSRTAGAPSLTRVAESDVIYMLAARSQSRDRWSIYGFYDAIPDTPRLAQMMCQAAIGSLPVVATFEGKTQGVSFGDVAALAAFSGGSANGPCTVGPPL